MVPQPSAVLTSSMGHIWDVATLTWIRQTASAGGGGGTVDQGTPGASPWLVAFSAPQHVIVDSSGLPTGAATAALQTQPGVDIGDVR